MIECKWCRNEIVQGAKICSQCGKSQNLVLGFISTWSLLEIIGLFVTVVSMIIAVVQATKATTSVEEVQTLKAEIERNHVANIVSSVESDSSMVEYFCAPAQIDRNTCQRARVRLFYTSSAKLKEIIDLRTLNTQSVVQPAQNKICSILNKYGETKGEAPNILVVPLKEVLINEFGPKTIAGSSLKHLSVCY